MSTKKKGSRSGRAKRPSAKKQLQVIGWREWVGLPDFGIRSIKAKVDTGARTSSLHAFDVEEFRRGKKPMVRFCIHPEQRNDDHAAEVEAPLVGHRNVKPSSGHVELRPVILAEVELMGERFPIELTLTRRDSMGFRMLLGRQATRRRFLIDPGRSFLNGKRLVGSKKLKTHKGKRS